MYARLESWLYRLLFVSFFLPAKLQTGTLILCCIWIGIHALQQRISFSRREVVAALLLGGAYLFYVAYIPLTPSKSLPILQSLLERKISIFLLPFMLPLMYKLSSKSPLGELHWFVAGNCIHGIIVNCMILFQLSHWNQALSSHVAYRLLFEKITDIHPTYYGMFICFSLAILLFDKFAATARNWYRVGAQIVLFLFLLLLTPKISLLIVFILYVYFFSSRFTHWVQTPWILLTASVVLVVSYIAFPYFHDRIAEVFTYFSKSNTNAVENSVHFRKLIYQIDLQILNDSWLFGIGPAKLQEYLDAVYYNVSVLSGQMITSYNSHNEYLNQWICFGLAGFLFFISIFIFHIKKAILLKNVLYYAFLLIVMVSCLTENILSRQSGIIFYAFFGALLYFNVAIHKVAEKSIRNSKVN
ncbi:MAG: O-antigen ligase family protein [Bacteroidetes bacterium]|nr:O-antigen ligase family protein [Bacteroidota bacterium]